MKILVRCTTCLCLGLLLQQESKILSCGADESGYGVSEVELITLRDESRNKNLELRVYYPIGEGPFPVVIFSHGNTSSKDKYPKVGRFLAGHGFVSIHPTHSDSFKYSNQSGERSDWSKKSMWDQDRWISRPKDISFVIDSIDQIVENHDELRSKLNVSKIAVAGHSFGANTAQLIGGAKIRLKGREDLVSFQDERVKAIVAFSPAGRGWVGMENDSWSELELPMLSVTGTKDFGPEGRRFDFRLESFLLSPPGHKYQMIVQGMGHNFRSSDEHFRYVSQVFHAFLDAYLLGSTEARRFIRSGDLVRASEGIAALSFR